MKTIKCKFMVTLFFTWTLQAAFAFYDPTVGRWLSRDPVGEPGFQVLHAATATPQMIAPVSLPPSRWIQRDAITNLNTNEKQGGVNRYGFVENNPIGKIDPLGLLTWSQAGEAIWTAAGYVVPGGEFPTAFNSAPDCAKLIILNHFNKACKACMESSADNCPICDDAERVREKMH
jgi:hypothetical protein